MLHLTPSTTSCLWRTFSVGNSWTVLFFFSPIRYSQLGAYIIVFVCRLVEKLMPEPVKIMNHVICEVVTVSFGVMLMCVGKNLFLVLHETPDLVFILFFVIVLCWDGFDLCLSNFYVSDGTGDSWSLCISPPCVLFPMFFSSCCHVSINGLLIVHITGWCPQDWM